MALAIFDLDNTLIAGDSDHAWGEFLVDQGIVNELHYRQTNDKFFQDYQKGTLIIEDYLAFALEPLAKNTLANLYAWRQAFFQEKIIPLMLPKALDLIARHRARQDVLMIVTATNQFVTEPIAQALGIEHLIATMPERNEHGFTGKVSGIPSFQEGKVTRLKQWLEAHPYSMTGSYFYSDSHNDLPLMKLVEYPVAIDPDDILKRYCIAHHWPIKSLRN